MTGNRLRVDRASIENNVDGTRTNVGNNRQAGEDDNTGVERTSNRTSEQASQFIAAARASANKSIQST